MVRATYFDSMRLCFHAIYVEHGAGLASRFIGVSSTETVSQDVQPELRCTRHEGDVDKSTVEADDDPGLDGAVFSLSYHRRPPNPRSSIKESRRGSYAEAVGSLRQSARPTNTRLRHAPFLNAGSTLSSGRREFHDYFVTHLPSSSLHPDSRNSAGPGHKLPRDASIPHVQGPGSSPAAAPLNMPSRDLTVVRIPLQRAKHHFGSATARGTRPYNEDTSQAGTTSMPSFAKRAPMSVQRRALQRPDEATSADSALGDPQIFYFGVFDGHGGTQCSDFLRDELHGYIEEASANFGLKSSLRSDRPKNSCRTSDTGVEAGSVDKPQMKSEEEVKSRLRTPTQNEYGAVEQPEREEAVKGADPVPAEVDSVSRAIQLERELMEEYRRTIGGYFRRFNPVHFSSTYDQGNNEPVTIESVLTYAFLRADLDFVSAQARKPDPEDPRVADDPLNNDEILGAPHIPPSGHGIGGHSRFKGGSTASIALISTPTAAPFWHPNAQSTLLVAHVGDTRVLLCDTATGLARPLTSDHHPTTPTEERRLRRYAPAGSMVSGDSFGELRIAGLANSRAFGDMGSKRIGVSAEPELTRVELGPAQYSFLTLVSDGVSGTLSDQEIVDVIKEARTPEQGSQDVVNYATEVSANGDNATCLVVRLGGWERRSEGGVGSLGTKEIRDVRRAEASDPRRGTR
ncbi:protein serine/threonine phosphatase 2C [Sodiomyces alkalinus F11]|uniref:Protein serine/threonine phosphatase 2C n=1 Tax=Sodiomyces alkalinus (strain CBS 110278 / VKM F-3762 / F11) TaxID=1314773 RepID=A0A3N2Q703_SODAK|nr:protein serine/threonine phosphatase 2C [Sodiomyces alkalinus F11]ROT42496.1 protein serine/threonine phosphatase 2C [Sodiomyces alkalinus F11]